MPLDKPHRTARASTTRLILPDKSEITIQPVTIEQVRRCIRLDPDEGHKESDREYIERVAEQFSILVGPDNAHLTGKLTLVAVEKIVRVLFIAGCGMDAQQYALWQVAEGKLAQRRSAMDTLRDIDAATVSLAAQLKLRPADVAATPLADCAALRLEIDKLTEEQSKWEAAIHGIQL